MNKDLIEKIVKQKFSFETEYGIKTQVNEVHVDKDIDSTKTMLVEVKFNRFTFIDVEKINELSKSLLAFRTRIFAAEDIHAYVMFWIQLSNLNNGD